MTAVARNHPNKPGLSFSCLQSGPTSSSIHAHSRQPTSRNTPKAQMISPSQSQCLSPQQRTQRNPRLATQSHPHHRPVLAAAHRRAAASFLNTQQQQKQHWRGVEHAVQQQQQQQHPRKQQQPASWICRSFLQASEAAPEPIPDGEGPQHG